MTGCPIIESNPAVGGSEGESMKHAVLYVVGITVGALTVCPSSAAVHCMKKKSGVVVAREACKKIESLVDLAEFGAAGQQGPVRPTGPTGPAGASGPTGPTGAPGIGSGFQVVDRLGNSVGTFTGGSLVGDP